jgi:hypothetical protein
MRPEVDQPTMTDAHDSDAPGHDGAVAHHGLDDHGDDHGHDDHAHGEDALGPLDWAAWGAGIVGVALGVAVTVCFVIATQPTT